MGTKFNFKSQICTTKEQSERLLALGLKKETADMCYKVTTHDWRGHEIPERDKHYSLCNWYDELNIVSGFEQIKTIPAWSLHRLLCLYNVHYLEFMGEKEIAGAYDIVIDAITQAIEGGYFNEKYLV